MCKVNSILPIAYMYAKWHYNNIYHLGPDDQNEM